MKVLDCTATRRRLDAFQDRELPVGDQIAVAAHLDWCDDCAARLRESRELGALVRTLGHLGTPLGADDAVSLQRAVVSRVKAEREAGVVARVRRMFDDLHLVYAALGAAGATAVCVVIMLGMMRFATSERPDSLAAIVNVLATPLECDSGNDFLDASGCRARWAARFQRANEMAEQDAVFTLESLVTHQGGRLTGLESLRRSRHPVSGQGKLVETLLDALTRARIEGGPLSQPDTPEMIWMVEHATVRASAKPVAPALDLPLPPKKRAAGHLPTVIRA